MDRWRSEEITVSAAENVDRSIIIDQLIPACSDGIDNDGDDAVDRAEGPACTDLDGNYDPADDNEVLKGRTVVIGRFYDKPTFVSSAEGERSAKLQKATNPLHPSVTVAKGPVGFAILVNISKDTTGEDFAIHLKTGESNENLTVKSTSEVVVDQDTSDGWVLKPANGFNRLTFADGPHFALYMWHGTKARGEGYGDGKDRVYVYLGQQSSRPYRFSWVYEPEDVPEDNQKSVSQHNGKTATLGAGECVNLPIHTCIEG